MENEAKHQIGVVYVLVFRQFCNSVHINMGQMMRVIVAAVKTNLFLIRDALHMAVQRWTALFARRENWDYIGQNVDWMFRQSGHV